MPDRDRVIALLEEQNGLLRGILQALSPDAPAVRATVTVASDRDLDGQYGNPVIRTDPRRWDGPTFRGRRYSECPPEYLDALAEFLEWQGQQSDKKNERSNSNRPLGDYRRQDAARARGWAKRIREGKVQQAPRQAPPAQQAAFAEGNEFEEVGDFMPDNWR